MITFHGAKGVKYVFLGWECKLITVSIDEIRLDPSNPRIYNDLNSRDERATQGNIAKILEDEHKLHQLAKSIEQTGRAHDPILLRHDGRLAEGNRRLGAYRILYDGGDERFGCIQAIIFPPGSNGDLDNYIASKHVAGTKKWASIAQAKSVAEALKREGETYESIARRLGWRPKSVEMVYATYLLMLDYQKKTGDFDEHKWTNLYHFVRNYGQSADESRKDFYNEHKSDFFQLLHEGRIQHCNHVEPLIRMFGNKDAKAALFKSGTIRAMHILEMVGFDDHGPFLTAIGDTTKIIQQFATRGMNEKTKEALRRLSNVALEASK